MARMDIDTYFMSIAELVKKRSTCIKQHVGAVLVKEGHIISTGYNGSPRGLPHCSEETCLRQTLSSLEKSHLCRGVHAEQNTIIPVSYTHLRAHETVLDLVCRLLLEKKN